MTNKEAIALFEVGSFSSVFIDYLKKENFRNSDINNFLIKAKEIHAKLSTKKKNIGMLVGKVQSGKTTVFSAVIGRYFDKGYDLCIILTSIENLLNEQTHVRMNKVFRAKEPSKVDIYNCNEFLIRNTNRRIEKIRDDLKNGHKYIVTILKNKQIEKINEVLINTNIWKNRRILIVDDEADLASIGSNDLLDHRFANTAIKQLLETLPNYNYLSVTATPHAQVLINDDDAVKPKHVFTYEPGEGYMGIEEFFSEEKYFTFIEQKEWADLVEVHQIPSSLKEAIIRYFINISAYILSQGKIEHTTMLIHTSVAIEDHYKIMRLIIKYKDSLLLYLQQAKDSLDYQLVIKQIKAVYDLANFSNLEWDDDYIELIKNIISYTNINVINSESDDNIIENLNNIVLGSRKVERGVTLDNLLLTYITNFHEGTTAVDTILQRARWFGYRQKIKDFLTIYIVPSLYNQYKNHIMPSEFELWNRLKQAERDDNFEDFGKFISLTGRSAPTNKVKSNRSDSNKIVFYDSTVDRDPEVEKNSKSVYHHFNQFPRINFDICGRPYSAIMDISFKDFCSQIKEQKIYEILGVNAFFWDEIKNKTGSFDFVILFLDDAWSRNYRERTRVNDKYALLEGSAEDTTGFPGEQSLYKVNGLHNKVIICLHKIRDKDDNKLRYYISLHLPKDNNFVSKYYINDK